LEISARCFDFNTWLSSVTFEAGSQLQILEECAFSASAIQSIEIPPMVTGLPIHCFAYCVPANRPSVTNHCVVDMNGSAIGWYKSRKCRQYETLRLSTLTVNSTAAPWIFLCESVTDIVTVATACETKTSQGDIENFVRSISEIVYSFSPIDCSSSSGGVSDGGSESELRTFGLVRAFRIGQTR
jgi:hypothetical protein